MDKQVANLQLTIVDMDGLVHEGFSQIKAVASLALMAMETENYYQQPETMARAVQAMWAMCDDYENIIHAEALAAGCMRTDSAEGKRVKAQNPSAYQSATEHWQPSGK